MIDFEKHKRICLSAILLIILSLVVFLAVKTGPLREAYVDISINPPEKIRKTDFSWLTVNEWFNSQVYIITSHSVLRGVKSGINKDTLKKIVSAKRLGAADIIRISARSNDSFAELEKVVKDIADLYLKQLSEAEKVTQKDHEAAYDASLNKLQKITKEINAIKKRLETHKTELESLESEPTKLKKIEERIEQIGTELDMLNTRLKQFQLTYTDSWPKITELKVKIDVLEREKEKLYKELQTAQKVENAKRDVTNKISESGQNLKKLQNKLKTVDKDLESYAAQKQAAMREKQTLNTFGRIVTPAAYQKLPEFRVRLLIGLSIGLMLWFVIAHLWDRLFKKRGIYL